MVRRLLPGIEATADAADALAVAICHAHHRQTKALWQNPSPPRGEGGERVAAERRALPVTDVAKRLPHPEETSQARRLRQNSTDLERVLWEQLRAKRFGGHKFRRQEPILGYTADFVCHERRLIIEVDGGQHADSTHDARRDAMLHQAGFRTLRFWNNEISENLDGVLQAIKSALDAAALSPTLSPGGRGSSQR
jgi:crossover junction endodeoxyribonuclease RuvC